MQSRWNSSSPGWSGGARGRPGGAGGPAPPSSRTAAAESDREERYRKGLCFVCGSAGHRARVCPSKRNAGEEGRSNRRSARYPSCSRKTRQPGPRGATPSGANRAHSKGQGRRRRGARQERKQPGAAAAVLSALRDGSGGERLLTFGGEVAGRQITVLVDSGAGRNFLDAEFAERCGLRLTPNAFEVTLAGGQRTRVGGHVRRAFRLTGGDEARSGA